MTTQSKSLYAVILTIACLASGYYLYTKFWPDYTAQSAALDLAQAENVKLSETLDATEDFLELYKKEVIKSSNVNLAIPSKKIDVANLLANLETLATQSAISLGGVDISESALSVSSVNAVQPVEISFSASGTYLQLKDFVTKIQTNLRLMDVYQITLISTDEAVAVPILSYQIKLMTYYQK